MSTEPFMGSIEWVAFDWAPRGWALCNGQLLPINQNQALFALLGTQYGGNGITNFALPDLRGRTPIGVGASAGGVSVVQGQVLGAEAHTLLPGEMPTHSHTRAVGVSDARGTTGAVDVPGSVLGGGSRAFVDVELANGTPSPAAAGSVGGSQPHGNMQPYLALNAIIALTGVFPSRN